MKKENLTEGTWIARGPETNLLIRLVGQAPLLDVKAAILLNDFETKGIVTELDKNSVEVMDVMTYPERYDFELPNTTAIINNRDGIKGGVERDPASITLELLERVANVYKDNLNIWLDTEKATNKTIVWLYREEQYTIAQAQSIIKQMLQYINEQH